MRSVCLLALTVQSAAIAGLPTGPASFRALGDVPGGLFRSIAHGVSADGSVVVGECRDATGTVAFRWTEAGGYELLGRLNPDDPNVIARHASADGATVVGQSGSDAFRWTANDGMLGLGALGERSATDALAISADGATIVGVSAGGAFKWTMASGMIGLGELPGGGVGSNAQAVSGDGSIIFGSSATVGMHSLCRWISDDPIEDLGVYDIENSYATDVSLDGSVVAGIGHRSQGHQEAFIWTEAAGFTGLGFLPNSINDSNAYGISGDGTIVVGRDVTTTVGHDEAFVWTAASGMLNLRLWLESTHGVDLTGWVLTRAHDISDDGTTIVGYGTDPCGHEQAWIVRLAPPLLAQPEPCPGDVNGDRAVDFADLNDLLSRFNQEAICGDLDHNGIVGFADLNQLISNFSLTCD